MLEEIVPKVLISLDDCNLPFVCRTELSYSLDKTFGFDIYRRLCESPDSASVRGNKWKDGVIRNNLMEISHPSDALKGRIKYHQSRTVRRNINLALEGIDNYCQRLAASYLCVRAAQLAGFVAVPIEFIDFDEFKVKDLENACSRGIMRKSLVRYNNSLVPIIELGKSFSPEIPLAPYVAIAHAFVASAF